MNRRRVIVALSSILAMGFLMTGCGEGSRANIVKISGSSSVGPVIEVEAEAFKNEMPDVTVEINQLGSSAGIKDAINGTVEIGISSRDLKEKELEAGIKEKPIAYDGMSVIVNNENPVQNLTMEQIKDIYTGKITNWKEVGGEDTPIVLVSREDGSGTRDAFQEIVGFNSEQLNPKAQISDGSGSIKTMVAGNKNAIGYISFSYVDDSVHAVSVDGVKPTAENVQNKTYKLSRPFLLVYKENNLSENSKKFIDFMMTKEGQEIVEEEGLISIG
ncbi:TPA: phosphate ABC transporter substrate-binding protein [Clostridium perfringens]